MEPSQEEPETLIIVTPEQASFYRHLKETQDGSACTRVILDRRRGERRVDGQPPAPDRRQSERRNPIPDAARALMSVLGFMVLHRRGNRWQP